ncbi:MAG: DUF4291 domain-containing protein [Actinomycetota bacterium]
MKLQLEHYSSQVSRWPQVGRYILAQFDENSIVVYQAYSPVIGHFAASQGYFGGEFSFNRMSWIKTNFLWMMYRSGWATKLGQEVILAVWIHRTAFDEILATAVHSRSILEVYSSQEAWQQAVAQSSVRLQWDPDRDPSGKKLERRAIQLGLRDEALRRYAQDWIVKIEDISDFVRQQSLWVKSGNWENLLIPCEVTYPVTHSPTAQKLQLSIP